MNDLYIIVAVLVVVVTGFFVVPFAKKKGWITKGRITGVEKALHIAEMVLQVSNIDKLDKNKAVFAFNVATQVVDYIDQLDDSLSKDDKMTLSLKVVDSIMEKYGVKPSIQEQQLINIIITEALNIAENVNK